jgi:hypothetical protein
MKLIILVLTMTSSLALGYSQANNYQKSGNTTYGSNANTGSSWNTSYESNGDMKGTDSKGNSWSYDKSSGNYNNYGTGKTCTGHGAYRVCN